MIPIPSPVVRGQVLTADNINAILGTLRVLRPIAGKGLFLRETSQGVVFEIADNKQSQLTESFAHPFQVTLEANSEGTMIARVKQGKLFKIEVAEGVATATEITFELEGLEADGTGWKSSTAAVGEGLTITSDAEGSFKLVWGTPSTYLYLIAEVTGDRYGIESTAPTVTQHILEDLYYIAPDSGWSTELDNLKNSLNKNVFTPNFELTYTEAVVGDKYAEETPAKLTLKIPYVNLITGTAATQELSVNLTGLAGGSSESGDDNIGSLPTPTDLTIVTNVAWDDSAHALKLTTQKVSAYIASTGESSTTTILTATPHSSEHTS